MARAQGPDPDLLDPTQIRESGLIQWDPMGLKRVWVWKFETQIWPETRLRPVNIFKIFYNFKKFLQFGDWLNHKSLSVKYFEFSHLALRHFLTLTVTTPSFQSLSTFLIWLVDLPLSQTHSIQFSCFEGALFLYQMSYL